MLRFERQVVATLMTTPDRGRQAAVERFVDGTLRSMPEHLRAGVLAESVALGTLATVVRSGRGQTGTHDRLLDWIERSPVGLLRQYVRLFRSLVLFAEQELATVPAPEPAR